MSMNISTIYEGPFFEMHDAWRLEYSAISDLLVSRLQFSSVLDLGCGNGFIIARLRELGKVVCGVDVSAAALRAAPSAGRELMVQMDLTAPPYLGKYDLVICTEVAEHFEAEFADRLVDNICATAQGLVLFTAATPGQGGHHHVNEQPHSYWVEKFSRRGFEIDHDLTAQCRCSLTQAISAVRWFIHNAMIFRAA
jgi:SAM-dependent methyltransferase